MENKKFDEIQAVLKTLLEENKEEKQMPDIDITINTKDKTIKLHSMTNLGELYDVLEEFNIDVDEYSIIATEIKYEGYPVYPVYPSIPYSPAVIPEPYNPYPFWYTTCGI